MALGRFEPIDLLLIILRGEMKPWLAVEGPQIFAVMLTAIITYPRSKWCSVFLVAGTRMDEWLMAWTDIVESYARHEGCDKIEGYGRPGWERVTGAHKASVQIVKDL